MNDRRTAGRQPQVQTLDESCAGRGLEELHLVGQLVGVVVGCVVDDQKLTIGRPVFQDGNQGVVQRLQIAQDGNDDRQTKHGRDSWVKDAV